LIRRVEDAIATLDYHPNEVARSLKVNRTFTIGVVVPDVSSLFFNAILQVVETKARRHGYSVFLCDSHEDPIEERALLKTLVSRRVDGILLASAQTDLTESSLASRRPPIVCFDREPAGFSGKVVVIDNTLAAYRAARHLIDLGHELIAAIVGPETTWTSSGRMEGFHKALQEAHIPLREEYIRPNAFLVEGGYSAALELFRLSTPPRLFLLPTTESRWA
jgi:LacI family transcriptional regulator